MDNVKDATGVGYSVAVSGGEVAAGSFGYVYSSGYSGVNYQIGVGAGLSPIEVNGHVTGTWLYALNSAALKDYRQKLSDFNRSSST